MDSTATQGAGLRERKKLATKQALALAAMQLAPMVHIGPSCRMLQRVVCPARHLRHARR